MGDGNGDGCRSKKEHAFSAIFYEAFYKNLQGAGRYHSGDLIRENLCSPS